MTNPQLFHCLRSTDADRMLAFLAALGFEPALVVRDSDDPAVVHHADLRWRDSGGVMLGSTRGDGEDDRYRPGVCNLVVGGDEEVDALVATAVAAGARLVSPPSDAPHGGRNACVADFDDNLWNLDSYQGA